MGGLPHYIVVEGPIGVGKTSLARKLAAEFDAELLLEAPEENPFLAHFYEDPQQGALPTQLCFLMQRAQQLRVLRQGDILNPMRVADFMLEKDRLFARLTLDAAELQLYEQLHAHLAFDAPSPDLVIYLQAPVDVLLTRIQKRGRDCERRIEAAYVERINSSYAEFFYNYTDASLLIVNAAEIDLVSNTQDYRELLEQIYTAARGRRYFNPLPFTIDL